MIITKTQSERGISLIETAIAVLVISLLVFPMLKLMEVGNESRLKQDGIARNTAVVAALERYWMDHGRLPRPASTYAVPGDSGYGQEASMADIRKWWEWNIRKGSPVIEGVQDVSGNLNTGWVDINLSSNVTQDTLKVTGAGWEPNQWVGAYVRLRCYVSAGPPENVNWHGNYRFIASNTADTLTLSPNSTSHTAASGSSYKAWNNLSTTDTADKLTKQSDGSTACPKSQYTIYSGVMIGSVPFAELGLSDDQSLDPYGRRLTYMVTASMTGQKTESGMNVPTTYAGRMDVGAIRLVNQLFGRGTDWEKAYLAKDFIPTTSNSGDTVDEISAAACRVNSDTTNNCCADSKCFPSEHKQYTMLEKNAVPFVIINHGRDGRGAIPHVPKRVTVSGTGVSGLGSALGASAAEIVRAEPYASCIQGGTYAAVAGTYYTHSVSGTVSGLGFDNCDHTLYEDTVSSDNNWSASMYRSGFNLSTVRVIQKEFKDPTGAVLGGIIQRFTYKPGPFYYDDIVTYSAGVDMRGWSERSSAKMLKQTSAELGSGWTMISGTAARSSSRPAFPLQIGLQPGDADFTDASFLSNKANLRANKLYTDLICLYGKDSASEGVGKVLTSSAFGYTTTVTANARMGCFSLGRFLSSNNFDPDITNVDKRRVSFACVSPNQPIAGVAAYNITDNNSTDASTRYFQKNNPTSGDLIDSFLAGSGSSRKEPFMGLNSSSCTQTKVMNTNTVEYDSGCSGSNGARKIQVDSDGTVDLKCN